MSARPQQNYSLTPSAANGTRAQGLAARRRPESLLVAIGVEQLPDPDSGAVWTARSPEVRGLLEGVAVQLRSSAAILRVNGLRAEAARADQFAARVGLRLDEQKATHFRRPHLPPRRELALTQWYAEHLGAALPRHQKSPTKLHEANARLHAETAELHEAAAACLKDSARALVHTNGDDARALPIQEWARCALERAQRERRRAVALAARK